MLPHQVDDAVWKIFGYLNELIFTEETLIYIFSPAFAIMAHFINDALKEFGFQFVK